MDVHVLVSQGCDDKLFGGQNNRWGTVGGIMLGFMRFLSLVVVVVALMLLGADLVTSLENLEKGGHIAVRSLAVIWGLLDQGSLEAFRHWASSQLPGFLVVAIDWLLGVYSWFAVGVIGMAMAFVFGRSKHEDA